MNQTFLLALLSQCRQAILEAGGSSSSSSSSKDQPPPDAHAHANTTTATTASPLSQTSASALARDSYDNAYFYILFVMFFYSFLVFTLFRSILNKDKTKKEPYEEFMGGSDPDQADPKFNPGSYSEKFYFEEENSL